jgi:hypothetical protein
MSATLSPDRQLFRETVAQVAEKARAILPQAVNGRVDSAVKLVLAGDVEVLDDGSIQVGSSDPTRYYRLVGTTYTCTYYTQDKAPQGWCKHRISAGIEKRVRELLAALPAPTLEAPSVPPAALPEAPASVNVHLTIAGRQVQLTLRDTDETRLLQRLQAVLAQYPLPPSQPQGEGWCAKHGVQMTQTTKDGRSWWSHKTDQGWCKGR